LVPAAAPPAGAGRRSVVRVAGAGAWRVARRALAGVLGRRAALRGADRAPSLRRDGLGPPLRAHPEVRARLGRAVLPASAGAAAQRAHEGDGAVSRGAL